jgi:hypothetical protein
MTLIKANVFDEVKFIVCFANGALQLGSKLVVNAAIIKHPSTYSYCKCNFDFAIKIHLFSTYVVDFFFNLFSLNYLSTCV